MEPRVGAPLTWASVARFPPQSDIGAMAGGGFSSNSVTRPIESAIKVAPEETARDTLSPAVQTASTLSRAGGVLDVNFMSTRRSSPG